MVSVPLPASQLGAYDKHLSSGLSLVISAEIEIITARGHNPGIFLSKPDKLADLPPMRKPGKKYRFIPIA
jgi:hypothetical protein